MREWVREELSTSSSWVVDIMPPKTDITDTQSVGDRELTNMSNVKCNADNTKPITTRGSCRPAFCRTFFHPVAGMESQSENPPRTSSASAGRNLQQLLREAHYIRSSAIKTFSEMIHRFQKQ